MDPLKNLSSLGLWIGVISVTLTFIASSRINPVIAFLGFAGGVLLCLLDKKSHPERISFNISFLTSLMMIFMSSVVTFFLAEVGEYESLHFLTGPGIIFSGVVMAGFYASLFPLRKNEIISKNELYLNLTALFLYLAFPYFFILGLIGLVIFLYVRKRVMVSAPLVITALPSLIPIILSSVLGSAFLGSVEVFDTVIPSFIFFSMLGWIALFIFYLAKGKHLKISGKVDQRTTMVATGATQGIMSEQEKTIEELKEELKALESQKTIEELKERIEELKKEKQKEEKPGKEENIEELKAKIAELEKGETIEELKRKIEELKSQAPGTPQAFVTQPTQKKSPAQPKKTSKLRGILLRILWRVVFPIVVLGILYFLLGEGEL